LKTNIENSQQVYDVPWANLKTATTVAVFLISPKYRGF